MERISTGIAGIDEILQGGIPRYATVLMAGAPGTGKTILTQNILYNYAQDAKVLYITTLSEPQIKVLRFQQEFTFFRPESFMEQVIYQDLGGVIRREGLTRALEVLSGLVKEHQPAIVAIDSIKAVASFLTSEAEFRAFISDLVLSMAVWECTVLLVGEYSEDEIRARPESAIADGIVYLCGMEERKHQKRYLRILKMRGTDFSPGEHLMTISQDGVQVYPRLNPVVADQVYACYSHRQPTGIQGLDEMMEGGVYAGTATLVVGGTGSGKTILGMNWLVQGARTGEPALMVAFEESPEQLIRNAHFFGWNLESLIDQGLFHIFHVSPIELDSDRHLYAIQQMAKEKGIKRIVVDSISTIEVGMDDKIKYSDYIWGMADFFKMQGISLMMVNENPNLFGMPQISKHGLSYVADNIIFFTYLVDDRNIGRSVGVLKMRGSKHQTALCKYIIGDSGLIVLDLTEENGV